MLTIVGRRSPSAKVFVFLRVFASSRQNYGDEGRLRVLSEAAQAAFVPRSRRLQPPGYRLSAIGYFYITRPHLDTEPSAFAAGLCTAWPAVAN